MLFCVTSAPFYLYKDRTILILPHLIENANIKQKPEKCRRPHLDNDAITQCCNQLTMQSLTG